MAFLGETLDKLSTYNWPGNVRELQHSIERALILSETDKLTPSDFILGEKSRDSKEVMFDSFNLESLEKSVIVKVLKKYKGNVTKAAKELGLTRTSLYRRIEKYSL
jgi:transcriptional regulator with PAS, ATPase and Fis domain